MHTQDLIIDESGDGHAVKDVLEFFPDADGVAAFALVVETVDSIDLAALVISSQQEEVLLELDFVGQEENDCLKRVLSSIDIVTKEQVVGLRREAAVLEEAE